MHVIRRRRSPAWPSLSVATTWVPVRTVCVWEVFRSAGFPACANRRCG